MEVDLSEVDLKLKGISRNNLSKNNEDDKISPEGAFFKLNTQYLRKFLIFFDR
jgi:hypothetical protein